MTRKITGKKKHSHGLERRSPYAGGALKGRRRLLTSTTRRRLLRAARRTAKTAALAATAGLALYSGMPAMAAAGPISGRARYFAKRLGRRTLNWASNPDNVSRFVSRPGKTIREELLRAAGKGSFPKYVSRWMRYYKAKRYPNQNTYRSKRSYSEVADPYSGRKRRRMG